VSFIVDNYYCYFYIGSMPGAGVNCWWQETR